jgi:hypothetical protein
MFVQDRLTGQLHEVPDVGYYAEPEFAAWPDPQLYGLGEVHDGFGNSLGLWFLPKLIGGAVSKIFGGGGAPAPSAPAPVVTQSCPACPPCPRCGPTMPTPPFPYPPFPYPYPQARRRRRR